LSYGLIGILGIALFALWLISVREEDERGEPFKSMLWFSVAIIAFCAVVALVAGYVQKAQSLEKVSHRVQAVTLGLE
jgi:small-conductance mechanosensitive channel